MRSQPGVTGFEDGGRGHETKSVGSVDAGRSKKWTLPWKLPKGTQPC